MDAKFTKKSRAEGYIKYLKKSRYKYTNIHLKKTKIPIRTGGKTRKIPGWTVYYYLK